MPPRNPSERLSNPSERLSLSSRIDYDDRDDLNNVQAQEIGKEYLRDMNIGASGGNQAKNLTPIPQTIIDEADNDARTIVTEVDNLFDTVKRAYDNDLPGPVAPTPTAADPNPIAPVDPKTQYPIFQMSAYEGRAHKDPSKRPTMLNYKFKGEEKRQSLDMNSKDAKEFAEKIEEISFEKQNAGFIMTMQFTNVISDKSNAMNKMMNELNAIRDIGGTGIACHFNYKTHTLELRFSSKAVIDEVLKNLTDRIREKDGKLKNKDFKDFCDKISAKFDKNEGVKKFMEAENKAIKDRLEVSKNADLDDKNPNGILSKTIAGIMVDRDLTVIRMMDPNLIKGISQKLTNDVNQSYQKELIAKNEIARLSLLKKTLESGDTNFDSIFKETVIDKAAEGIQGAFNKINGITAKYGLNLNGQALGNFVSDQMQAYNTTSVNPMIDYANKKVSNDDLIYVKAVFLKEIDDQIEIQKKEVAKEMHMRSEMPVKTLQELQNIHAQRQLAARGRGVAG